MRLKLLAIILVGLAVLYAGAAVAMYAAMRQPPERFGAIMAKVPMPAMMILPFKPLWMSARSGRLSLGDSAPDFTLPSADHSRSISLSEECRTRPVVLIFGSYT